jgi:hypothetical protein
MIKKTPLPFGMRRFFVPVFPQSFRSPRDFRPSLAARILHNMFSGEPASASRQKTAAEHELEAGLRFTTHSFQTPYAVLP